MKFRILFVAVFVLTLNLQGQDIPCGSVFNDTFDEAGVLPEEWAEYNTSGQVTVEDGRMKFDYTQALPSAYRSFDAITKSFSYSFDVESTRNYVIAKMHLMSSSGKYLTSIIFGNNGAKNIQYATALDGSNLPTSYTGGLLDANYDKNITYSVSLAADFENKTVDFYLNGELKVEDIAFLEDAEDFAKIDINHIAMYSNEGRFFFDNITVLQEDVNRIDLSGAITFANNALSNVVVGDSYGKYPQASVDLLETKVEEATAVAEDCSATQTAIDEVLEVLDAAQLAFEESKVDDPVLKLYSTYDFGGEEKDFKCGYYNGTLGDFEDKAVSFKLDFGYMATFAQDEHGRDFSKVYIASEGDLEINLPEALQKSISFVRVGPWRGAVQKRGFCGKNNSVVKSLKPSWFYDWGASGVGSDTCEYVVMNWSGNDLTNIKKWGANMDLNHQLAFNEPDGSDQANMTVDVAITKYENLQTSGLRLGSPAVTDGAKGKIWRDEFMEKAIAAGYRIDFIAVHYYKRTSAANFYKWLKDIHDTYKLPIWITEFNYGATWSNNTNKTLNNILTGQKAYLAMLDTTSFVERYSMFTWQPSQSEILTLMETTNPVVLNTNGEYYSTHDTPLAYTPEKYEQGPELGTGVNDLSSASGISIYPNPASSGKLMIDHTLDVGKHGATISIYALQGGLLKQIHCTESGVTIINIDDLSKGMYMVQYLSDDITYSEKIIVN